MRVGRDRAAVGAARRLRQVAAGGRLQRRGDRAHHRVLGADVAAREPAQVGAAVQAAGEAEEAGVLARAVVVQRARLAARRRRARCATSSIAASACRIRARSASSPALASMRSTTAMCAGSPLCEAQASASSSSSRPSAVGGAALDQRQRLQHLDGRAREDRPLDVAERGDDRAVGIDDGDRAAVHRLARVAAHGFDEDRVVHRAGATVTPTIAAPCTSAAADREGRLLAGIDFTLQPVAPQADHDRDRTAATAIAAAAARRSPSLTTLAAFEAWLQTPGPWLGAFDFPFGLPRVFVDANALGTHLRRGDGDACAAAARPDGLARLHRRLGQRAARGRAPAAPAQRPRLGGAADEPDADALRAGRPDVLRRHRRACSAAA